MTDSAPSLHAERRRNAARRKDIDIAYQVLWNEQARAFEVLRAGQSTGNMMRDKARAISFAIFEAGLDAKAGLKVVVYSRQDGRQTTEWSN